MEVRTKNDTAQLFWTTFDDPDRDATKHVNFSITPNDSDFTEYVVDVSQHAIWAGTVDLIQFDPVKNGFSGDVYPDFVRASNYGASDQGGGDASTDLEFRRFDDDTNHE